MLSHADRGIAIDAHAETHLYIGPRGSADRVHLSILRCRFPRLISKHEKTVLVPRDFVRAHPECFDAHAVNGAFIFLLPGSVSGVPMRNSPAGNRHHVEGNVGAWDGLLYRHHRPHAGACRDLIVDSPRQRHVVGAARTRASASLSLAPAGHAAPVFSQSRTAASSAEAVQLSARRHCARFDGCQNLPGFGFRNPDGASSRTPPNCLIGAMASRAVLFQQRLNIFAEIRSAASQGRRAQSNRAPSQKLSDSGPRQGRWRESCRSSRWRSAPAAPAS